MTQANVVGLDLATLYMSHRLIFYPNCTFVIGERCRKSDLRCLLFRLSLSFYKKWRLIKPECALHREIVLLILRRSDNWVTRERLHDFCEDKADHGRPGCHRTEGHVIVPWPVYPHIIAHLRRPRYNDLYSSRR